MKRVMTTVAACALLAACGRGNDDALPLDTRGGAPPAPTIVEGCLTAQGDRFVLTQLQPSGEQGQTTTVTYQLVNADDQLREFVGRQVRVSGEAEAPAVANLEPALPRPPAEAGTSGDAEVQTAEQARLEISQMRVIDVTSTGDECAAETDVPETQP